MNKFKIGNFNINRVGLGCMGMSHGYGKPTREDSERTLNKALDIGYNFLDTAALYGFGENEKLIGDTLAHRRHQFVLASKCGLIRGSDGKRSMDARPDVIRQTCETSLRNLKTDCIDLYYLHRVDPKVALEDQIGTLGRLVEEGKIRFIGLSEASETTLRRANKIHKISALQSEYSLWTRNAEHQVLQACAELDVTFVAFSPLGRGFLTNQFNSSDDFLASDLRSSMPRFSKENFPRNLPLRDSIKAIANTKGCTLAQIALAWIMSKQPSMVVIPGTTNPSHVAENFAAQEISLSQNDIEILETAFQKNAIYGERYDQATMATMET